MYGIEILLIAVLAAIAQGTNSSQFANRQTSWLMGGFDSGRALFPFVVSLKTTDDIHFCGGTIINAYYILTAAHCIAGKQPKSIVVMSSSKLLNNRRNRKQDHEVDSIITHHHYNPSTHKNDIGLVKLKNPIVFGRSAVRVNLPAQNEETPAGSTCIVLGWGVTSPSATTFVNHLQVLTLKVISVLQCLQSYLHVSVTYICGDAGPGKRITRGDEGGPLICQGRQVGVITKDREPEPGFGPPRATLFVKVAKFIHWIEQKTN